MPVEGAARGLGDDRLSGADGADLLGLADPLGPHLPGTAFYAPDAAERCVNNPMGYQWFPIPWLDGSTEDQARASMGKSIADVDASGLWPGKVVTEVSPAPDFWEAEPEHQDYLQKMPWGYTCHFVRPGWVLPRRGETQREETTSA